MVKTNLNVFGFAIQSDNKNFLTFSATAGLIGTPTRATPHGGSKGFKVVIENSAADNISELVGSGVNCLYCGCGRDFKAHDKFFKIGVIDNARVDDGKIIVDGHLWKTDFPDICDTITSAKDALGCSIEIFANGFLIDEENKTETLQDVHFTGMAIVYKDKAAFEGTNFMCSIRDSDEKDNDMTDFNFEKFSDDIDKKLETFTANFSEAIQKLNDKIDSLNKPADNPQQDRKTVNFDSKPQFENKKTIVDLAREVDEDPSLSVEQRWAKKLNIWKTRNIEEDSHE